MVKRKLLTALITLIVSVPLYSFISKGPVSDYVGFFLFILTIAVLCGTLLSIFIGYLENKINFHSFSLRFILHIIIALLLTAIFVENSYFQITFYLALPVAVGYFVIDEVLRTKLNSTI
ncbi:hypothetical protein SAMN05192559_107220 [Halobacillus karajensis]|uniref:hypothetical protein n=1 Tax=Halobacillus karajensis TaxID=195088 RepID=UPI0008A7D1E9|nr:hypothetical protein [Halobacillus karajensis]SEI02639.1 hypothetical protein SAMN05192559_107220 [Halobacillus karajensis]